MMSQSELILMIGYFITLIGAIIIFYTNTNVRLKALEIEVNQLKNNAYSHERKLDQILDKLDENKDALSKNISEIKVDLQNKQNRV